MGNSASSVGRAPHDDTVDFGALVPQGVYTGPRDWNNAIVTQLIVERKLAPFYRPLEEYEDSWDDDQILAARKEFPDVDGATPDTGVRAESVPPPRPNSSHPSKRSSTLKEPSRSPEAMIYRSAVECPICFLYYPPNINRSRCCDQAICTECFVQIKRAEPTPQHLVSEPAACPYCVQDNFGVVYTPPTWRAGIGADNYHPSMQASNSRSTISQASDPPTGKDKSRRKSFGYDSPEVVTIDHIRPDWEAKLAAVKAAVARRANRRIIMRQVGDRLIPIGVTSGRIHPLAEMPVGEHGEGNGESAVEGQRSSRRSRRRHHQQGQNQDINQLLGTMGLGGQDLEELMVMEAMRLSLLEHEEQQKKEAEKKRQEEANGNAKPGESSNTVHPSTSTKIDLPPIPTVSSPVDISSSSRNRDTNSGLSVPSSSFGLSGTPSSFLGSTPESGISPLPYRARTPVRTAATRTAEAGVASALATALLPVRSFVPDADGARPRSGVSTPNARRSPSPSVRRSMDIGALSQASPFSSRGPPSPTKQMGGAPAITTPGEDEAGPSSSAPKLSSPSLNSVASSIPIQAQPYDELPSSPESSASRLPLLLPTTPKDSDSFPASTPTRATVDHQDVDSD